MTRRRTAPRSRRAYLKRAGATACIVGLAGCSDALDGADDGGPAAEERPTNDDSTETETESASGSETESETETESESETETESEAETETESEEESETETESDDREVHEEYETTEVRVTTPDGEALGSVTAAVADTTDLRYAGLSDTESLPEGRGMVFVYEETDERTFVMREMDFGIDIVYADDEGTITRIHHAPAPGPNEDGEEQRYPGRGRYVLEVNYEWTAEREVEEGDVLEFEL